MPVFDAVAHGRSDLARPAAIRLRWCQECEGSRIPGAWSRASLARRIPSPRGRV
jgi:NMD protein affecting ribosome stability and mRNA decay